MQSHSGKMIGLAALALSVISGLFLVWGVTNMVTHHLRDTLGFPQDLALYLSPFALLLGWISRRSGKGKAAIVVSVVAAALVLCLPWPRY